VPVLCVSPNDDVEERIRFLEAGADDVMARPFDARELEARVEAARGSPWSSHRPSRRWSFNAESSSLQPQGRLGRHIATTSRYRRAQVPVVSPSTCIQFRAAAPQPQR
jgi:DNA-binding response OmpR family regulator